jgi:hypothetical protein
MKKYSDTNYFISEKGEIFRNNRKLKPWVDKDGYQQIYLYLNGVRIIKKVHRLVAEVYIQNPFELPQINHLDGNKKNNQITNLEWSNSKENNHHALLKGLRKTKIKIEDIQKIKDDKRTAKEIASDFNVHKSTINKIRQNKSWNYKNKK